MPEVADAVTFQEQPKMSGKIWGLKRFYRNRDIDGADDGTGLGGGSSTWH